MKKIFILFIIFFTSIILSSCKSKDPINNPTTLEVPNNLTVSEDGIITWDKVENATSYILSINDEEITVTSTTYSLDDLSKSYVIKVKGMNENKKDFVDSNYSLPTTFKGVLKPTIDVTKIKCAINGKSEVRSSKSINLTAHITGLDDSSVTWEITKGSEFASINDFGKLTAKSVETDKIIEVTCVSTVDERIKATKAITILSKPTLTQEMLDALNTDTIGFEGYVNINLYTIGLFEKLYNTYSTQIKTAMNGVNWYAEYYNGDTFTNIGIYYKNHNGLASQVGVSFTNEESYSPLLDERTGEQISWEKGGLYNSLKNLKVSDFKFNEEIWRYEYVGKDKTLAERVIASANPYDFITDGFALIIEENEILGIYAKSKEDYTITEGYKAIQELIVAINTLDSVEVKTIGKYSHEDIHDELNDAILNMQKLNNYTLTFKEYTASVYTNGVSVSGYEELITQNDCFFTPFTVSYNTYGNEVLKKDTKSTYGYHKITDNLYNAFSLLDGRFTATRAYESAFKDAMPSLEFAAEIFRQYYRNEEEGTTTYYVDEVMSGVASTFYYGVGNDINLYGIFATRGYFNSTDSFTPYVTIKDGYILDAGFYYYLGSMYGVVEIEYSNFNKTSIPEEINIEFETRYVPVSWSELTIEVSDISESTEEDVSVNALTYLKEFFNDDEIESHLPFFGVALKDTYGFGLTTLHMVGGTKQSVKSIVFYYDVPLDIDYTISTSINAVEEYLYSLGFKKNEYNEFTKDNIGIAVVNSSLDLLIYVWKN